MAIPVCTIMTALAVLPFFLPIKWDEIKKVERWSAIGKPSQIRGRSG